MSRGGANGLDEARAQWALIKQESQAGVANRKLSAPMSYVHAG